MVEIFIMCFLNVKKFILKIIEANMPLRKARHATNSTAETEGV